jgi:long-chain fatty acid transport protein
MGFDLILPTERVSSRINAGALGGGFPPVDLAGTTGGEPGVSPVPYLAFVHKSADSPWSFGVGMFGIAGYSLNYPASETNPILTPQPPNGLGVGKLTASVELMQIVPTVSYAITDQLSVGFAPTVTLGRVFASPLFFAPPDDADGDGFPSYPTEVGSRYHWGGGFQLGVYYITATHWHFGAALKSPQWIEDVRFHTADELGRPNVVTFDLDYPLIVSLGTSYDGLDNWIFACDARYFDYGNTPGFQDSGFAADGRLLGLGWQSVFSVSVGAQRRLTERLFVRGGYSFNENPIDGAGAQSNVASPLIFQHNLYLGTSFYMTEKWSVSLSYMRAFENRVSGPMSGPLGPIAGTSITSSVWADAVNAGITVRF